MIENPTTDVLRAMRVEVSYLGDKVTLKIGNAEIGFHYEQALKLSQWLRMQAKMSKASMGDISRHWSGLAVIEDAEEAYKRGR